MTWEQELFILAEDYVIQGNRNQYSPHPTRSKNACLTRDWLLEFYEKAEKLKQQLESSGLVITNNSFYDFRVGCNPGASDIEIKNKKET